MPLVDEAARTAGTRRVRAPAWRAALLVACGSLPLPALADGSFLVEPGDVLRISVMEMPSMARDAPVDVDGRISLPQAGRVEVAGSDLDAVAARIAAVLAERDVVRRPTVLVEIASYRPAYVGGDVMRPGAIEFRPGLTVRHALILAGGVDTRNGEERLSSEALASTRMKLRANAVALLRADARVARLDAELDDRPAPDFSSLDTRLVPPEDARTIISLETGLFEDRRRQRSGDLDRLRAGLANADTELDALAGQLAIVEKNKAEQTSEIDSTQALADKNQSAPLPRMRLEELQRENLYLSTDLLNAQAAAARARQNREDLRFHFDTADAAWRIGVRDDLATALAEQGRLQEEGQTLQASLLAAGLDAADDAGDEADDPRVTIHRLVDGTDTALEASMTTAVQPGDILEVAVREAAGG